MSPETATNGLTRHLNYLAKKARAPFRPLSCRGVSNTVVNARTGQERIW